MNEVDANEVDLAYLQQLSREVTALEMLKEELLDRNARLERWHQMHGTYSNASVADIVQVLLPFTVLSFSVGLSRAPMIQDAKCKEIHHQKAKA